MSRSGYSDDYDCDYPAEFYWKAVDNATKGKRGQKFFRDLLAALDALPRQELIAEDLVTDSGSVCAIGALGLARGIEISSRDPDDYDTPAALAKELNAAECLVRTVIYENDERRSLQSPEERFARMRAWVEKQIKTEDRP